MSQHALRSGQTIDLIANVGHLARRHDGFLRIGPGRRADKADRRFAVEKDFLDEILPGQIVERATIACEQWIQPGFAHAPAQTKQGLLGHSAFAPALGIGRIIMRPDVMRLHIENEVRGTLLLGEGRRLKELRSEHVEKPAEH